MHNRRLVRWAYISIRNRKQIAVLSHRLYATQARAKYSLVVSRKLGFTDRMQRNTVESSLNKVQS